MRFTMISMMVLSSIMTTALVGCSLFGDDTSVDNLLHAEHWDDLNRVFEHSDAVLIIYDADALNDEKRETFLNVFNTFSDDDVSVALIKEYADLENAPSAFQPYQLPMVIVFHEYVVYDVIDGLEAIESWVIDLREGNYMMPTTRHYDEVEHINHFDETNAFTNETYVYVYSRTCPACTRIRNDMIALAVDAKDNHTILFVDIATVGGEVPTSIRGVPALLIYDENGDYDKTIIGTDLLDYLRDTLE